MLPPEDDYLECHIKSVGDWTGELHELYDPKSIVDGKPAYSLPSHILQVDGPHADVCFSYADVCFSYADVCFSYADVCLRTSSR
jgi:hypothetical protein